MPNFNAPEAKQQIRSVADVKLAMARDRSEKVAQLVYLDQCEPNTKIAASTLEGVRTSTLPAACMAAEMMNKVSSKEVTLQDAQRFAALFTE